MKRLLILIAVGTICLTSAAQSSDVKKVIKKYDARYLKSNKGFRSPADFWTSIALNDKRVADIAAAFKKENKTLFESMAALDYAVQSTEGHDLVTMDMDSVVACIVHDLGIENIHKEHPIKVLDDNTVNASMDPVGQMRINKGCFQQLTYGEILAVCAHETAHLACSHVLSRVWSVAKKQKRNKMWADIGTGLAIGAIAATSGYGAANGQDTSHFNEILANADILFYGAYGYADDATNRYSYRYSREEESEADIIAYRFMEQMGYGGESVLSMLKKLNSLYGDTPAGKYDDHPSNLFRIQVVSALMSGYEGK